MAIMFNMQPIEWKKPPTQGIFRPFYGALKNMFSTKDARTIAEASEAQRPGVKVEGMTVVPKSQSSISNET